MNQTNNKPKQVLPVNVSQREAIASELLSVSEYNLTVKYYKPWRTLKNY